MFRDGIVVDGASLRRCAVLLPVVKPRVVQLAHHEVKFGLSFHQTSIRNSTPGSR